MNKKVKVIIEVLFFNHKDKYQNKGVKLYHVSVMNEHNRREDT